MITTDAFAAVSARFPALAGLDGKLAELARQELQPDEQLERVDPVMV